ncbi:MAG: tRNA pseudouridine(13) synthase TruD [archaeon]
MKIKQIPEDFRVEEKYKVKFGGQRYAIFILEKRKWTTTKAIEMISKKMRVSINRFNVAGQKDRQGITRQCVSCMDVGKGDVEYVRLKDMKLEFQGYSDFPIQLGGLEGNKFIITIREIKESLEKVDYVPNYFDNQRFGDFRPVLHLVGKEILLGNYERAVKLFLLYPFEKETRDYKEAREEMEKNFGDWFTMDLPKSFVNEKKIVDYLEKNPEDYKGALKNLPRNLFSMTTQAYQSYLFNVSLSRYLERFDCRKVKYCLGELNFCKEHLDMKWPLIGYESQLDGEVKEIYEKLMKEEGITYETFNCEIPKLASKGIERDMFVKVQDLKLGKLKNNELGKDKKQEVSFFLGKGSYATMVLKGMEND